MDDTQEVVSTHEETQVNPMVHVVAPVVAIVGTMVIRKMLNSGYEKLTGRSAPLPRDPAVPLARALMWTVVITTSAAVAEVVIYRAINSMGERTVEVEAE
jgi:hypothetical protein